MDEVEQWANDIQDWITQTEEAIYTDISNTVVGLFNLVVDYSPHYFKGSKYSTGQFVANWQVGDSAAMAPILGIKSTPEAKKAEIRAKLTPDYFRYNKSAYIVNCLVYAPKVEYEGWKITSAYMPIKRALAGYSGEAPVTRAIIQSIGA